METMFHVITPFILAVGGLFGFAAQDTVIENNVQVMREESVELGLSETSPRGEMGGFAIPASGCSPVDPTGHRVPYPVHDCSTLPDISVDKPVIHYGDSVTVSWDPKTQVNCVLSANVMALVGGSNPATAPNANLASSITNPPRITTPTGETTFTITCDGNVNPNNIDTVIVKVLPKIQET